MTQSFAKVALTPKWISALLLALAVAAIFALLGQWQLDRALTTVGTKNAALPTVPLGSLGKPGEGFKTDSKERKVEINIEEAEWLGRIANRQQDGQTGYWQVALGTLTDGNKLVFAYDFQPEDSYFKQIVTGKREGYYLPSEEPQQANGDIFESLSVEQLINQTTNSVGAVYPGFVAVVDNGAQNPIKIEASNQRTEINALNAFYAVEWILFAGFAVFLWWRLVQDERLGLRAER